MNEFLSKMSINQSVNPIRNMKKKKFFVAEKSCFNGTISPNEFFLKENCVYFFVVDDEVLRIGETSRTLQERLKDYNNKKMQFITSDLCSFFTKKLEIYAVYCDTKSFTLDGDDESIEPTSKMLEQYYINKYVKMYGELPKFNKTFY